MSGIGETRAAQIARLFPSFREFVDDALFHPEWGYYSTGQVRFGEGGHFDTYPLALSPLFGRMLARYAHRLWWRAGQPSRFEIGEFGAGNGQLCLDTLVSVDDLARRDPAWQRFAAALRYRIIERSPSLVVRQRRQLGPLAHRVVWTEADLAQRAARGTPFAPWGLLVANEVLDCLAHHKIVQRDDDEPGVVFVVPVLQQQAPTHSGRRPLLPDLQPTDRAVPRAELGRILRDDRLRRHLTFREVTLPLRTVPGLRPFLRRHYPEFFSTRAAGAGRSAASPHPRAADMRDAKGRNLLGRSGVYFVCPAIETLIRNSTRLYRCSEALWIDYGDTRAFHLEAPEHRRVFAGPPRSKATVFRNPGRDDITFMVDFSVVATAAERSGCQVAFYGAQGELARRSGVRFARQARDLILRYRTLAWMLALVGVGAEREWQRAGLTWGQRAAKGGRLRGYVKRSVDEFLGKRPTPFKLMILKSAG